MTCIIAKENIKHTIILGDIQPMQTVIGTTCC